MTSVKALLKNHLKTVMVEKLNEKEKTEVEQLEKLALEYEGGMEKKVLQRVNLERVVWWKAKNELEGKRKAETNYLGPKVMKARISKRKRITMNNCRENQYPIAGT